MFLHKAVVNLPVEIGVTAHVLLAEGVGSVMVFVVVFELDYGAEIFVIWILCALILGLLAIAIALCDDVAVV